MHLVYIYIMYMRIINRLKVFDKQKCSNAAQLSNRKTINNSNLTFRFIAKFYMFSMKR